MSRGKTVDLSSQNSNPQHQRRHPVGDTLFSFLHHEQTIQRRTPARWVVIQKFIATKETNVRRWQSPTVGWCSVEIRMVPNGTFQVLFHSGKKNPHRSLLSASRVDNLAWRWYPSILMLACWLVSATQHEFWNLTQHGWFCFSLIRLWNI